MRALALGGLIERSRHLADLSDALADVQGERRGRLVLVAGEAGAGKSDFVPILQSGISP